MSIATAPASPQGFRYYDFLLGGMVAVLLCSNLIGPGKVCTLTLPLIGNVDFGAGNLFFPISYIFGDVLTEVYGFKKSRRVIWAGFGSLALASLVFAAVRALPGEAQWQGYAGQGAYDAILGGMSSGGIVLASLSAYLVGEFSNSVVLARLKVATAGKWLWLRTIASTLVGEGIDSVIFIFVATLAGVFPRELFGTLVLTNYIFKVSIEVMMTPATYAVVAFLKRAESEDYYDRHTRFNPFGI